MKNKFSFSRIGLMLKADGIEYKKAFFLFAGLTVAINLLLFLQMATGFQAFLLIAGLFFTLTAFYVFTGWKVHRSKHHFLTLPASTLEKFIEILIICLILFGVYFLIYTVLIYLAHLKSGEAIWILSVFNADVDMTAFGMVIGLIIFICAFQFMCCIAIRKYSLVIGSLFLIIYAMVIVYSTYLLFKIEGLDKINNIRVDSGIFRSNAIFEMSNIINTYNTLCMCIAAIVLTYISFLKLKEKQIR